MHWMPEWLSRLGPVALWKISFGLTGQSGLTNGIDRLKITFVYVFLSILHFVRLSVCSYRYIWYFQIFPTIMLYSILLWTAKVLNSEIVIKQFLLRNTYPRCHQLADVLRNNREYHECTQTGVSIVDWSLCIFTSIPIRPNITHYHIVKQQVLTGKCPIYKHISCDSHTWPLNPIVKTVITHCVTTLTNHNTPNIKM